MNKVQAMRRAHAIAAGLIQSFLDVGGVDGDDDGDSERVCMALRQLIERHEASGPQVGDPPFERVETYSDGDTEGVEP